MNRSIRDLPGIGEKRALQYAKLGINTIGDLLRHFPRAYQYRGNCKPLADITDEEVCAVLVTVATEPRVTPPLKNRLVLTKFRVFDDSASATVTFFQQSYLKEVFRIGMVFRLWGKFRVRLGKIEITSPQFEPLLPGRPLPDYVPIYPLTDGLSNKMISSSIGLALDSVTPESLAAHQILPSPLLVPASLPSFADALRMIHRPTNSDEIALGRSYFVYESLYLFSLGIAGMKNQQLRSAAPHLAEVDMTPFLHALPFSLTPDQNSCVRDILQDMGPNAPHPMARLISGDVGSGKTVVAAAAIYRCVMGGKQALLMAPTEILATQHYKELSSLFAPLGIPCALLTGSTKTSEKRRIRSALADGTLPFVIGTHALLSEGVHAQCLGLVVTDEQHRFGVKQRAHLASEGNADPHVLVMSATPIPRTLALILYGDLSVSTIETLPPGRQKIDTFVVDESYRARLNAFIAKQVGMGGQVYIVCPAIEPPKLDPDETFNETPLLRFDGSESDTDNNLHYAIDHTRSLAQTFPDLSIACLHGKMKPTEKEAIMSAFAAGEISVLVSTTVIEVGVNVPNATLMLVENADRFGLSQLHQLRGRVGRGNRKSYCVLISNAKGEVARRRLEILAKSDRGYEIANEDLKLRGPGDFFPTADGNARQSGEFSVGIASLCSDFDQLRHAAEAARAVIDADPTLSTPENTPARLALGALFQNTRHSFS